MTQPWLREREAWTFIVARFVPWIAGLQLLWETLQLPLYTIWRAASAGAIAFAVVHCTLGDVVIAFICLVGALVLGREGGIGRWRWRRIGTLLVAFALAYTAFSEWSNTARGLWAYSELMPTLTLAGTHVGVSPLIQWIVVPPLALYLSRRGSSRRHGGPTTTGSQGASG